MVGAHKLSEINLMRELAPAVPELSRVLVSFRVRKASECPDCPRSPRMSWDPALPGAAIMRRAVEKGKSRAIFQLLRQTRGSDGPFTVELGSFRKTFRNEYGDF